MSDLEPAQYIGIALAVGGVVALLWIRFAVKMAFRTAKLVVALALIAAGLLFYVNGGGDEVQRRIDEQRQG